MLAFLCLAAMLAYIPRNCLGVAEEDIRSDLGLSKGKMSLVMSAFFITYAAFQIPTGWLGHVWGTRRALPLFATLWSVAGGLVSLAAGMPMLLMTRLGMGVAQAGIFPCTTSSLAKWFPATRRGLVSGLLGSCMQLGAVVAAILTGFLLGPLGWRWLFVLYAVPGIAWAVWFFVWFRDRPEDHPGVNAAEQALIGRPQATHPGQEATSRPEPTPWIALFTSWAMLCICGQQLFRAAGYMFYGSWFTTFLKETRGIGNEEAGVLTSLPIWAYVIGSGVGGQVSDWILVRTGSRRLGRQGLSAATSLACALLIVGSYYVQNVWLAVLVITAGSFCAAIGGPCAYAITIDMGGKHVPPVFSTMNMSGNIGAAVFPLLVPPLLAATGNWDAVLFLFAGIYLAAGLFWMLFDSNGTIFDRPRPA
ncbi:MAG: MFS transporter [Planctomycetes bacterium]|nr:MFS transporter [Planctomycetota bacterium]